MADWFKLHENSLDEMRLQWAMSEQQAVLSVWIGILSECCRDKSGTLAWADEDWQLFALASRLKLSPPIANQCLGLLQKIQYISISNGLLKVLRWNDFQSEYMRRRERTTQDVRTVSEQCAESVPVEERRGEERRPPQSRVPVEEAHRIGLDLTRRVSP